MSKEKTIYDLELHERGYIVEGNKVVGSITEVNPEYAAFENILPEPQSIMRVPGGWVYERGSSSTFVPYCEPEKVSGIRGPLPIETDRGSAWLCSECRDLTLASNKDERR